MREPCCSQWAMTELTVAEHGPTCHVAEITRLRAEIVSTPTWFSYRVEDWADALQSIRLKLKQDAQQIVDLIHERDEALARLERAERVVEAVSKHTWIGEGSQEIQDVLTAWQEARDAR